MTHPVLIVTGTPPPAWVDPLQVIIHDQYHLRVYEQPTGYVARLADDHAALIVVNGDQAGWEFWTTAPKSSSATRRIPVFVISESEAVRTKATTVGADLAFTPKLFLEQAAQLIAEHARILDSATIEQLDCECHDELPPLAVQAVKKFNAGEYYPQHDLFEEQWMLTKGPVRDLYRAVLLVGIAYYQIERGNHRGALKMLLRSVQWLAMLPDVCQGIDIRQLREDSGRVRVELEKINPNEIGRFDRSLLKPIQLVYPHQSSD